MTEEAHGEELTAPSEMSFEAATKELEELIEQIEKGEIGLEQSLAARRRGDALIKHCRSILDSTEQELQELTPDGESEENPSSP